MPVIIIDQNSYEVDQQKNVLESAISLGLDLPYFCWHPQLGSIGSCRLCAVQQFSDENDKEGRTVMACMTEAKDSMRFSINHPTCSTFRKSVLEWIMINHPHDCPVCDEGGECHLQDMLLMSGHNYRRHRFNKRTFRNQNLGPFINHEMNRCITCYRCVRYYKDIAGGTDLSAFASSGRVYFGRTVEGQLESDFSGNLVEICPTGVFTDKPFHKRYTRKWDIATAPSICQLCSVGCNISPGERGGKLRRVQNRYHHDVNGYFLCDRGRFGHDFVNADSRLIKPSIKDHHDELSLKDALRKVKSLIDNSKNVVGIGSPRASLEANWLLRRLVSEDHFYDGLAPRDSVTLRESIDVLKDRTVEPASLKDIREADAILIVGEDVTNTAPMMALSIRQGVLAMKQEKSRQDIGIPPFNDTAVRDYARENFLPIFTLSPFPTKLDKLSQTLIVDPFAIQRITSGIIAALSDKKYDDNFREAENNFIVAARDSLRGATRPVIIAGGSLGDEALIKTAHSLAKSLNSDAKLALVAPDANSIGLGMLRPNALADIGTGEIDVAIVLENDLNFRLGSKPFQDLRKRVKNFVVIDALQNDTTNAASIVLPSLTFFESTGTMVNAEGRLQKFFSVSDNTFDREHNSLQILSALMREEDRNQFSNNDDVCAAMGQDLGIAHEVFSKLYDSKFTILGKKIPKETSEYSGRTALTSHISMHEIKPKIDPDSPFLNSMEGGSRTKLPLPLVSTPWRPAWNSVQAMFVQSLKKEMHEKDVWGGQRLFSKNGAPLCKIKPNTTTRREIATHQRGESEFYVVPRHHIYASVERANFSSSLALSLPKADAEISDADAKKHGFSAGARVILSSPFGKFSLLVRTNVALPLGIIVLPYGLIDASLFFTWCSFHVVSEESV